MHETLVDLSVPVDPRHWEPNPVKVDVIDHRKGADELGKALILASQGSLWGKWWQRLRHAMGLGVDHRDFPDEKGLSLMTYTLTTHTGTHMDAPFHYGDVTAEGKPARTICEVPLSWCYGNGVMLDVSGGPCDEPVTSGEIMAELERIGYALKPLDIVLLKTGGDRHVGTSKYFTHFRGMSVDATACLIKRGVKVIGIDSFSFDAPFDRMLKSYLNTRDPACLWPAHIYGRKREYCQIERITNLDKIVRPFGFKVACFPINLALADAAWCRVVAIL
jgi:kynurenine formamidase